jgi:hypothetical protein
VTTKGIARHDRRSELLRQLPELVARAEARGHPVIVDLVPPVPEHSQRLYASLGVLVRFVPRTAS